MEIKLRGGHHFILAKHLSLAYLAILSFIGFSGSLFAEGSKDFVNYPGYRLFLDTRDAQQFKVYADVGETINVGASHVGVQGGYIQVFDPMGNLVAVFDNTGPTSDIAIIHDDEQEANGPTGDAYDGYEPGVIEVQPGEEGIWTVVFDFPFYQNIPFQNIPNAHEWNRGDNQPNGRAILAWDITVTQDGAGNMGGEVVEGRVYTNEYVIFMNGNGFTSSPIFYVLTKEGFIYQININEIDPFRARISSNSLGLVDGNLKPIYKSKSEFIRSENIIDWIPDEIYLFEPQARDTGDLVNNKLFFNIPNPDLPSSAETADFFRGDNFLYVLDGFYTTWLRKEAEAFELKNFYFLGISPTEELCASNTMEFAQGGYFILEGNLGVATTIQLDLDNNSNFDDPVDVVLEGSLEAGFDTLFWDGFDGLGNPIFIQENFEFGYRGTVSYGELHIGLDDVENNEGGVTFEWLNPFPGTQPNLFYYDHRDVEGTMSGGLDFGDPLPTSTPFTYVDNFGNDKYLDYWFLVESEIPQGNITLDVAETCPGANSFIENGSCSMSLDTFAVGFEEPIDIAHGYDDRLFVAEKRGKIWALDTDGNKLPSPFLDIENSVNSAGDEQGLLGLTFHPEYQGNGYFFVTYTQLNGDTRISRFKVSDSNPNNADPMSEMVLLEVEQPAETHNGGGIKFGPDGYLYIALGDGGTLNDGPKNAQNTNSLLGKMLRIDVDNSSPYSIPTDNPFVGNPDVLDEIWSIGLRHPWRFSFDPTTGDLWIGDEGQDRWEEINRQPAASAGGENYGWNCYEGSQDFITAGCVGEDEMTFPVFEYPHFFTTGSSVIGGHVLRNCNSPCLYGKYIFADHQSGRFWTLSQDEDGEWRTFQIADLDDDNYIGFGENSAGEIFVIGKNDGTISKISSASLLISITDEICEGDMNGSASINIPTDQVTELSWGNGETTANLNDLSSGNYSVTVSTADGCHFAETAEVVTTHPDFVFEVFQDFESPCGGFPGGGAVVNPTGPLAPELTVQWDNGETGQFAYSLSAGTHSVTVSNSDGCIYIGEVDIFEPPVLEMVIATSPITCNGNDGTVQGLIIGGVEPYEISVLLNGDIIGTYSSSLIDLFDLEPGSYDFIVIDANGCGIEESADLVEIPPLEIVDVIENPVTCTGLGDGSAQVIVSGGSPDYFYEWSNGHMGEVNDGLAPGIYEVTVTDLNGCALFDSIEIVESETPFQVDFSVTNISSPGNLGEVEIELSGGTPPYTIEWDGMEHIGNTGINLSPGFYEILVHDSYGCTEIISFTIGDGTTSVFEEKIGKIKWQIIPNITSDNPVFLKIKNAENIAMNLKLVSSLGQVLENREAKLQSNDEAFIFELNQYPAGLYFLSAEINGRHVPVGKIIRY